MCISYFMVCFTKNTCEMRNVYSRSKDSMVYFFTALIKHEISPEMRKAYSDCFTFHGVFCENIREIRKVYSGLYGVHLAWWIPACLLPLATSLEQVSSFEMGGGHIEWKRQKERFIAFVSVCFGCYCFSKPMWPVLAPKVRYYLVSISDLSAVNRICFFSWQNF